MRYGVRIDPNGTATLIEADTYEDIRNAVGGWIEGVPCDRRDITIWCNEEGKLDHLPLNYLADMFWAEVFPVADRFGGDLLVGPVLVTGGNDGDGEHLTVPAWVIEFFGLEGRA